VKQTVLHNLKAIQKAQRSCRI